MSNSFFRQIFAPYVFFPGKTTKKKNLKSLVEAMKVHSVAQKLIRIGSDCDGGYLIPDDLNGIRYCFSPGVDNCCDFEMHLAECGVKVFMADASVDNSPKNHPNFNFQKKFISSTNCFEKDTITLDTWFNESMKTHQETTGDCILQMDIEGSEYEVLHNISDTLLNRFRIFIIEFHKLHQLADRFSFRMIEPAIRKLLKNHVVVHAHPNNYRAKLSIFDLQIPANMEMTFLRRDRFIAGRENLTFPHPLDVRCDESKPEMTLPQCWF